MRFSLPERLRAWIVRYGPSEVAGTVTAVVGLHVARVLGAPEVAAAYAGALSENVGFYGVAFVRELRATRMASPQLLLRAAIGSALRNLAVEFGPAELMDSLCTRPFAMGVGVRLFGEMPGALLGKLLGDVLFYLPVVITYEIRRHRRS